MKTIILLAGILILNLSLKAQSAIDSKQSTDKVVINKKMITRFNDVNYTAETVNFNDLYALYSFNEVKSIVQAYRSGDIDLISLEKIDNYLTENNEDTELIKDKSELNHDILASQLQINNP